MRKACETDGIHCPSCSVSASNVTNSRPYTFEGVGTISRRRRCHACGHTWSTVEIANLYFDVLEGAIKERAALEAIAAIQALMTKEPEHD